MAEPVSGLAPAKVNLALEVCGRRPDRYHEIDTILQELELADRVTVTPSTSWAVTVSGPHAVGVPVDETNLALKAAMLLAARVGGSPVSIHLEKQIPAAGGLGGGASNAATVLKLLGTQWPGATRGQQLAVAEAVGSDEAFFMTGGTGRAQGRGERVTPLPALPSHDVVLFVPPQTIERKTARMFEALGRLPFDDGRVAAAFAENPPVRFESAMVFNAFERVAFDLFPWLADLWEGIERRISAPVHLCGAGPCLFWIGQQGEGSRIAALAQGAACEVIPTRTVNRE
ncbi:MAG: 4-(cytidine 5'-diphospho)-2-C-methyl-D-erythritol kinase [Dehalococcoidia bacterium]|nr:4-(cytidine 5'-diphospho)-2-C-methyl-D-erythritol kinase [Dehalococcoidia bacterium]